MVEHEYWGFLLLFLLLFKIQQGKWKEVAASSRRKTGGAFLLFFYLFFKSAYFLRTSRLDSQVGLVLFRCIFRSVTSTTEGRRYR